MLLSLVVACERCWAFLSYMCLGGVVVLLKDFFFARKRLKVPQELSTLTGKLVMSGLGRRGERIVAMYWGEEIS